MSQLNPDDPIRHRYYSRLGFEGRKPPHLRLADAIVGEGGHLTGKAIVNYAIDELKRTAKNPGFYDSWACHTSTIGNVLDKVRKIVKDLKLQEGQKQRIEKEINQVYEQNQVHESTVIDETNY